MITVLELTLADRSNRGIKTNTICNMTNRRCLCLYWYSIGKAKVKRDFQIVGKAEKPSVEEAWLQKRAID